MAIDVDPYKWLNSQGCCNVMFIADMWRTRIAFGTDAYVCAPNRGSYLNSNTHLVMGLNASFAFEPTEVVGRFERRHLSPRFDVTWTGIRSFTQGYGVGRLRSFYSTFSGPPDTPWVILQRLDYPSADWFPISPPFQPLALPRYVPDRSWTVCPGCSANMG